MTAAPSFEALYKALDFERPLDVADPKDRKLYVEGLHLSGGIHPVDELRDSILFADTPGTWLFTGHRGVGKSTELRRLAEDLRKRDCLVIVADMSEYLSLAHPIRTDQLLLTLAGALVDGVKRELHVDPLAEGLAKRFFTWLRETNVQVQEVEVGVGTDHGVEASFKVLLKEKPRLMERIREATRASPSALHAQVREVAREVARLVHEKRSDLRRVVLILDSLERLRVTGSDAQQCYEGIQSTFDLNGEYLKLESIDVVYSVPPYLPFLSPRIGSYFGVNIAVLPHIKVFQTPNAEDSSTPSADERGLEGMVQSVKKRYPAAESVLSARVLKRLALASSGGMRDFFRLVRTTCLKANLGRATMPLDDMRWPEQAEDMLRNEMPLSEEDRQHLKLVHAKHGPGLDKQENLHKLARLFDSGVILTYRNGKEWCDVHHLLREQLEG